jgi:purine-binding chemotaxis protein CheW
MNDKLSPYESLVNYFDDLLKDDGPLETQAAVRESISSTVALAQPDQERQQKLERLLQSARSQMPVLAPPPVIEEIQEWDIEPVLATGPVSAMAAVVVGEAESAQPEQHSAALPVAEEWQIDDLEWLDNGLPPWAQTAFDALLFQVSGLTLAVPLIALGQIQPLTDELTPLFGQADWFMGLQPTPAGKIRTVNTAKFVMPERYDESFVKTAKYVVSINGVPWGLAVDSVNQPIRLNPEDVKWRSERSKRPWLAGTVKAHMCALLDIPRIGQLLVDADKNAPQWRGSMQ